MRRAASAVLLLFGALTAPPALPGQGVARLDEAISGLSVPMRVLVIAAHPDDEDTQLITWLSRGRRVETAYLALTRGDGGQNLLGNELGEPLGVIRTEELLAARRIDGELFAYLSHWYNPAIRELAARDDFQEEPRWIAAQLRPRISPAEAAEAMKLLLSLGLLVRDAKSGRVERGEPTLTTEHEVRSLGAAAFHRQMLERAAQSIETVPAAQRDLAALTVCVSAETAALVKQRIHQLREALTELCDADTKGSTVYQLNIQWFPLSLSKEDGSV